MAASSLALLGGAPAFDTALPVGQLYFPEWSAYETAMRGIFERQYYTNQGPLARKLEAQLQKQLGVKHVICVANATIGLMMAADALQLHGKVITPSFSFMATSQSLTWAGLEPLFCDVDPLTHQLDPEAVAIAVEDREVSAILAVNLWGNTCDPRLQEIAERRGIPLYFDSAHAFGCVVDGKAVGNFGALEVFSFHATKVLSAAEGGCVTTNDDQLAARLRNIRSSYGAGEPVQVERTANGRMSEAQAAIALLSLENFPNIVAHNTTLFQLYEQALSNIPGLHLALPSRVNQSNWQYVVCEIDEEKFGLSRDELQAVLRAENVLARRYFYPGIHRCTPYAELYPHAFEGLSVTEKLCEVVLQLPIGQLVDESAVRSIAGIIVAAHEQASELAAILREEV